MIQDNATHTQRARILKELENAKNKGLTTIDMRERLNIMHPSGRIKELRELGCDIRTVWTESKNAQGHKHRNARYVLMSQYRGKAA